MVLLQAAIDTMLNAIVQHPTHYPLANPKTKPAETLDTSGIPTHDRVPE